MAWDAAFAHYVTNEALSGVPITHLVHKSDPILQNNGPLWTQLGFKQTGLEVWCDPYEQLLYEEAAAAPPDGLAWNIVDHCKYLGVFVGPRWG